MDCSTLRARFQQFSSPPAGSALARHFAAPLNRYRAPCPADSRVGCAVNSSFRVATPGGKMPPSTAAKMAAATSASRR